MPVNTDKNELALQISRNIRFLRITNNLTIRDISYYLDVSDAFMGLMERGKRGVKLSHIIKLKELFNCSYEEIIHGKYYGESKENSTDKISLAIKLMQLDDKELELLYEVLMLINKFLREAGNKKIK